MKRLTAMAWGLLACSLAQAAPTLTTDQQKLSYTIGYQAGSSLNRASVQVNEKTFMAGFNAGLTGATAALTPAQMQMVMVTFQQTMMAKMQAMMATQGAANAKAGQAFLAANKGKPGVQVLDSGVQYKVITMGTGPKPDLTDAVQVDYEGTLTNGKVFDSSYARHQPATFKLNQVIPGWGQALTHMPEGSTWMIYIPCTLAYGMQGPAGIGPNQTLIFKVHLIKVNP